jgi:hypothetical protein
MCDFLTLIEDAQNKYFKHVFLTHDRTHQVLIMFLVHLQVGLTECTNDFHKHALHVTTQNVFPSRQCVLNCLSMQWSLF